MKKRSFIATIAVAIIAGLSIFMACTKEEISVSASSNKPDNKLSYESELEAAGQMHNNILYALGCMIQSKLDSCATLINNSNYSPDYEAFMLQVVQDSLTKLITQTTLCPISEDSIDFIFDQIDYYLSDDYFDFEFTNSASDMALSNILTANSNATNIQPILCDISTAINNIDMTYMSHNDSVTLASLILSQYSLNFWSDAYTNIENPWHNLMTSIVNNIYIENDKSNGPRKVWQWIKQKIINPVLTVIGCAFGCDVLSALVWTNWFNWSIEAKTIVTAGCSCIGLIVGIKIITSHN